MIEEIDTRVVDGVVKFVAIHDDGTETPADIDVGDASTKSVTAGNADIDDRFVTNLGARARLSSSQTISNATMTKVAFDDVSGGDTYDDRDEFDTSNNQFVADKSGKYYVRATVKWDSNTGWSDGDRLQLRIDVNGSGTYPKDNRKLSTNRESFEVADIIPAHDGDTISVKVYHDSGGDRSLVSSDSTNVVISQIA